VFIYNSMMSDIKVSTQFCEATGNYARVYMSNYLLLQLYIAIQTHRDISVPLYISMAMIMCLHIFISINNYTYEN